MSVLIYSKVIIEIINTHHFYAPQPYREVLLRRVLAMAILSVCPSVTTRCVNNRVR